ncbi:peptide/nickel transport system permease protein [Micromonospora sp. HB375]|uniref:ABC transporter permease n=1 Tax=Micromonospora TaxID=1873 RepID=UPI001AE97526|nr:MULTISPECIES: ABC transporter permease [unclassified Micromonospora]MBP1780603.1 peptide/nickel transport system permease protein [Micromonospora sp. HB375]MDH6468827.1 peptide/nickel transport system permease protein [Micromonospora sp. H404/HB375]
MTDLALPARVRRLRRPGSVGTTVAVVVLAGVVAAALLAPVLWPLDQSAVDLSRTRLAPSADNLAGTDDLGRDVALRSLYGLRVSLLVGAVAALVAAVIGGLVGALAGSVGGWVDRALMRVVDTVAALPHLLLGIFIVAMLRPSLGAVIASIALTHWLSTARIVRSELLSLRNRPFVDAAISGGASRARVLTRHLLPHVLPRLALATTLMVPHAVWHETALSFLGLGLPPHLASIGNMINDGQRSLLTGAWWASIVPGLLLVAATLALAVLTGRWRDRLDPRVRAELQL